MVSTIKKLTKKGIGLRLAAPAAASVISIYSSTCSFLIAPVGFTTAFQPLPALLHLHSDLRRSKTTTSTNRSGRPLPLIDHHDIQNRCIVDFTTWKNTRAARLEGTRLASSTAPSQSAIVAASLSMLVSTLGGKAVDAYLLPSTGTIVSLLLSAFISNTLRCRAPGVYDLGWTTMLPASLVLLLLSSSINIEQSSMDVGIDTAQDNKNWLIKSVSVMAVPFFIASLASAIGCWVSFRTASAAWWPSRLRLTRHDAQAAMACLAASFIGGSVNCLATARIVQASTPLIGSLAAADVLVMAVYFAGLSALGSSLESSRAKDNEISDTTPVIRREVQNDTKGTMNRLSSALNLAPAATIALCLAWSIVQVANCFEAWSSKYVKGTACAVIAVLTPLLGQVLSSMPWKPLWRQIAIVSAPLSDLCLLGLFSSIGMMANVSQAVQAGPASLAFSSLALSIHVLLMWVGATAAQKVGRRISHSNLLARMSIPDVLVASNAAIGGAATAATFANSLPAESALQRRGRVLAGVVWGMFGYAIGTMIGVSMHHAVGRQ